jgi:ribonuclease HI
MFYNSKFILSWKVMFSKWTQSSARHNVTPSSDISTRHAVGLYWVPGHAGVRGNEITDELARGGSVLGFLGPEPGLAVPRQDI